MKNSAPRTTVKKVNNGEDEKEKGVLNDINGKEAGEKANSGNSNSSIYNEPSAFFPFSCLPFTLFYRFQYSKNVN